MFLDIACLAPPWSANEIRIEARVLDRRPQTAPEKNTLSKQLCRRSGNVDD